MKKSILLLLAIAVCFSLTACNGSDNSSSSNHASSSEGSSTVTDSSDDMNGSSNIDDSTSDGGSVVDTALKDGTYSAEGTSYDSDGYKPRVEITVSDGKINKIDFNGTDESGKKHLDADKSWGDKIKLFGDEVIAKGLDAISMNDDGTVDGIDGMDLDVSEYYDLLKDAINKAKA